MRLGHLIIMTIVMINGEHEVDLVLRVRLETRHSDSLVSEFCYLTALAYCLKLIQGR
jgi:hypothetical protein